MRGLNRLQIGQADAWKRPDHVRPTGPRNEPAASPDAHRVDARAQFFSEAVGSPLGIYEGVEHGRQLRYVTLRGQAERLRGVIRPSSRMVAAMEADFSWTRLQEPWERLRWARERLASLTQEQVAKRVGMDKVGYGHHERDPTEGRSTKVTADKAMLFAPVVKARWRWILSGEGEPYITPAEEAAEIIARQPLEQQRRILASVRALTGTDD